MTGVGESHRPGDRIDRQVESRHEHRSRKRFEEVAQSKIEFAEKCPRVTAERDFWMSELLEAYGFGYRRDVSPIFTDAEKAAAYVCNYVCKSYGNRTEAWKGIRLVEYGRGCRPGSVRFCSIGGRAQIFREGAALYCKKRGLEGEDLPDECEILYAKPGGKSIGRCWAYFLRQDFQKAWEEFARMQPF